MSRLPRLSPSIGSLKPAVPVSAHDGPERYRWRSQHQPWQAWYKTARWQRLRWEILTRDLFTCQCGCGTIVADTSQLVCDHVDKHNGDPVKFWSGPFQTLWKPCHDRQKQREEQQL